MIVDTSAIVYWIWRTIRKVNTLFPLSQTCKVEKNKKERDYKLLQANYERLIELNKDLQIEAKDRNYSVEIQLKELKDEYEKVIHENVKLKEQNDVKI